MPSRCLIRVFITLSFFIIWLYIRLHTELNHIHRSATTLKAFTSSNVVAVRDKWPQKGRRREGKKRDSAPCLLSTNEPTGMVLMLQHDLYFYIYFTYDYAITYFQFAITIRLHYRVRCNPKVIQIQLTANDIHEVLRAPVLCL